MPNSGDRAGTLLLGIQVPFFRHNGQLYQETQACDGLKLWAQNFEQVLVMGPVWDKEPPTGWSPIEEVGENLARIECHLLPAAYRPDQFLRHLLAQRVRIRTLIEQADYMSFSCGGLWGNWGAVGVFEAYRLNRKAALWTDRVESQVVRRTIGTKSLKHSIRAAMDYYPMVWLERALARRATVGLFHGRDTYIAFSPYCKKSEVVHDIHLQASDHISQNRLAEKLLNADAGPLKICYVGRANAMKGPFDWLEVLEKLANAGVGFTATWLGDGEDLPAMKARISKKGLERQVQMPGFTTDRDVILRNLQDAHLLMFCHKTPESPRNLIEALVSACPIVGYGSPYSEDLISKHGGGILTPLNDVEALAVSVRKLADDRAHLRDLIDRAARDGAPFDGVSVFRHRSDLIKRYC